MKEERENTLNITGSRITQFPVSVDPDKNQTASTAVKENLIISADRSVFILPAKPVAPSRPISIQCVFLA